MSLLLLFSGARAVGPPKDGLLYVAREGQRLHYTIKPRQAMVYETKENERLHYRAKEN